MMSVNFRFSRLESDAHTGTELTASKISDTNLEKSHTEGILDRMQCAHRFSEGCIRLSVEFQEGLGKLVLL